MHFVGIPEARRQFRRAGFFCNMARLIWLRSPMRNAKFGIRNANHSALRYAHPTFRTPHFALHTRYWLILAIAFLSALAAQAQPVVQFLVPSNTVWHFFRGTNEASTPPTEWRTNTFDDSSWEVGGAPFYYGANYSAAGVTLLNDM